MVVSQPPVRLCVGDVEALVRPRGAELVALRLRGVPYLYEGDAPEFWPKSAPVLFPVVGRSAQDRIVVEGQSFAMPRHGFARELPHELTASDPGSATFVLRDDATTRTRFPFSFALRSMFTLTTTGLRADYRVTNCGPSQMPFSFGLHPAFRWPLDAAHAPRETWRVRFPRPMTLDRVHLVDGLRVDRRTPVLRGAAELPLDDRLFSDDALVFENPDVTRLELVSTLSERAVLLECSPASWLGIWSIPGAPFLCLEPWQGVAGHAQDTGDVATKAGLLRLSPGASWDYRMQISLR